MTTFTDCLDLVVRCINAAWSWFYQCLPSIAITMLLFLIIASIVIDRIINPMIGKATNGMIDQAMYGTKREVERQKRAEERKQYYKNRRGNK